MHINRRSFIKAAAAVAATSGIPLSSQANQATACAFKTRLYKALIAKVADDATCERLAKSGFLGVELTNKDVTIEQARQGRLTAAKHGVKIHSFMYGWAQFNNADPAARRASIDDVKRIIQISAEYGASVMLLVPCRIDVAMPKPSQFKIEFDPRSLHVKRVADGDPAAYAEYIAAQNNATDLTRQAVEELIPVAAREGVTVALENVWNNLWVLPDFATAFTRSFDNPWVQAYFDLGNSLRYAPTEEWLRKLNNTIVKLHIKDFKIDRTKKNDGEFVPIGKGSIDWKSVRKVIDEIGYNGWVTIESSGYTDSEHSALMDRFFAGQGA
jgi:L-ribulose-5-phosphate 3-epimerase